MHLSNGQYFVTCQPPELIYFKASLTTCSMSANYCTSQHPTHTKLHCYLQTAVHTRPDNNFKYLHGS